MTSRDALPVRPCEVPQARATGWDASLQLAFELRGGTTVMCRNAHVGPLQVQKALYPEGLDTCHIVLLHPPGGIAAGDTLDIRADLDTGARALLTTPGAAKWYRAAAGCARQTVRLSVAGHGVLEWLPRENIFFDGSNVTMGLDVSLAAESTYLGWEILSFGRRASGERWQRGRLAMHTTVRRAGRLLWSEIANLDAAGGFAHSTVGLAGRTVCATLLVAGADIDGALVAHCRHTRVPAESARLGITRLPGVLVARYLGDSTEEAFNWFTVLWTVLRPAVAKRAACAPRVWAC